MTDIADRIKHLNVWQTAGVRAAHVTIRQIIEAAAPGPQWLGRYDELIATGMEWHEGWEQVRADPTVLEYDNYLRENMQREHARLWAGVREEVLAMMTTPPSHWKTVTCYTEHTAELVRERYRDYVWPF